MNKTLQDRVAIVTGGAQGLGAAICRRLADEGCHVVVADLNVDGAKQTAADIAAQTGRRTVPDKGRSFPIQGVVVANGAGQQQKGQQQSGRDPQDNETEEVPGTGPQPSVTETSCSSR